MNIDLSPDEKMAVLTALQEQKARFERDWITATASLKPLLLTLIRDQQKLLDRLRSDYSD